MYPKFKIQNFKFKITDYSKPGITLLLAILLLSGILAISFSLSTILLVEIKTSGNLIRSEPSIYASNGVTEQALFVLKRNYCLGNTPSCITSSFVTDFNNKVSLSGQPVVSPTTTPTFVVIIPPNTTKVYDFCGAAANTNGCGYGKVQVTYSYNSNPGSYSTVSAYLCQWDPSNTLVNYTDGPCSNENFSGANNYWMIPDGGSGILPTYPTSDNNGVTLTYNGLNSSNNIVLWSSSQSHMSPLLQQELRITNNASTNAYVSVSSYGSDGTTPKGLPYVGSVSVTVGTVNGNVSRKIEVVVPTNNATSSQTSVTGSFAYEHQITLNSTNNLTNFTALVCANGSPPCNSSISNLATVSNGGHVQNSNGYDIVFSTTSCNSPTLMNWEMEKFVPATGRNRSLGSYSVTFSRVYFLYVLW